ncbi:hypothetical protein ABFX02_07G051700 [Erythranthe guttata]
MDMNNGSLRNDLNTKKLHSLEISEVVVVINGECEGGDESESESESESQSLLLRNSQENGLSEISEKPRRKVQWLDKNGDHNLAEIFVFEPSESDEEEEDSCFCRIM